MALLCSDRYGFLNLKMINHKVNSNIAKVDASKDRSFISYLWMPSSILNVAEQLLGFFQLSQP